MMRARTLRNSMALLAAAALIAVWNPGAAVAQPVSGARAVIDEVVARGLVVLRNQDLSRAEKRVGIEAIAYAHFDFHTIARLVLARYWKIFDTEQRVEFEDEFKVFLAQEYGKRLDDYEDQGVEVLGEKPEARGDVTVRTRIVGGEFDKADVNYRLRKKGDEWVVIDVVVEGISLVSNWRDQFREILRGKDGPEKLLAQIRKKNALPRES